MNEPICGTRSSPLSHPVLHIQRIVGGKEALPGDCPWQVGFAKNVKNTNAKRFVFCGGTLISNEWIVSAAHCFERNYTSSDYVAVLGEHNLAKNEGFKIQFSLNLIKCSFIR